MQADHSSMTITSFATRGAPYRDGDPVHNSMDSPDICTLDCGQPSQV
ncbi:hypothetical protein HZ326_28231, partial [Fusarium oxysporum f. sp. albedinis]